MNVLEGPVVPNEFARQPVEQFGVRRRETSCTEIAGRIDQSASEMKLPQAIDDHAGRQRVVARRDPFGEFAAANGLLCEIRL